MLQPFVFSDRRCTQPSKIALAIDAMIPSDTTKRTGKDNVLPEAPSAPNMAVVGVK